MYLYPQNTRFAIKWDEIIRRKETPVLSERASSRMIRIASYLPDNEFLGWQMIVPTKHITNICSFGSASVKSSDLIWIAEEAAKTHIVKNCESMTTDAHSNFTNWNLYEVYYNIENGKSCKPIGFESSALLCDPLQSSNSKLLSSWPMCFSNSFGELIKTLRTEGAWLRFTVGKATTEEQLSCSDAVLAVWNDKTDVGIEYIGNPVRAKLLILLPDMLSARQRAIINEVTSGAVFRFIGNMSDDACRHLWENPLSEPRILPDFAARILAIEPIIYDLSVVGIESCLAVAKPIPALHSNSKDKNALRIGKSIGASGLKRDISVSDADLRRHWQIIGQTGTGKSTLLASVINESIISGRGVTFFDPHGSTIDVILQTIPMQYANRIRVVRIGDIDNPVPINMFDTDIPDEAEKTISDLNLLFAEIFDPRHEGIVGPRWERWFSTFASASIGLLGKKASFESILTLSQNRENISMLAKALSKRYPNLSHILRSEYADNDSREFVELLNWLLSKFQRITSIAQLRNTLGAGANALSFNTSIDSNTVTLIDLGSPVIGTHAARIVGTLLLLQLWNAVMARKRRDLTHLLAIDEVHLFQTNPLPQMLAESRKFGLAMILAHQHCGQLTHEVRDSLDANCAGLSAFRLSQSDAVDAVRKFDDASLHNELCRLNAFNALSTLSVDGKQTSPFTLLIEKPKLSPNYLAVSEAILQYSLDLLVTPYRSCKALSRDDILTLLDFSANNPSAPLPKVLKLA